MRDAVTYQQGKKLVVTLCLADPVVLLKIVGRVISRHDRRLGYPARKCALRIERENLTCRLVGGVRKQHLRIRGHCLGPLPILRESIASALVPRHADGAVSKLLETLILQVRVPSVCSPPCSLRLVGRYGKYETIIGKHIGNKRVGCLMIYYREAAPTLQHDGASLRQFKGVSCRSKFYYPMM